MAATGKTDGRFIEMPHVSDKTTIVRIRLTQVNLNQTPIKPNLIFCIMA